MASPLLEPIGSSAWNDRMARHLVNRAGFGIDDDRIARLAALDPAAAAGDLVDYDQYEAPAPPPPFLVENKTRRQIIRESGAKTEDEKRKAYALYRRQEREAVQALKAWWLARMYTTPRPLEEKLALFWHGHFATSAQKVQSSWLNFNLNQTFREHAAGNFKDLTIAVGQSPSMLIYLDNRRSTNKNPNENWARELMELFTIGIGHYTEADIKEAARAFTGWTCNQYEFVYNEKVHDFGEKRFFGRIGHHDGWDVINILFEHPATSEFICAKLWSYFAYEDPEPEIVRELAFTFRANRYELRPVLTQMFLSRAFYSDRALGRQVKNPAQLMVQLCADLGMDRPPFPFMARMGRNLGQDLFYPPNVKGWDGNRAWINANSLLVRYNLPVELASPRSQRTAGAMTAMRDSMTPMMADDESAMMKTKEAEAPAEWKPEQVLDRLAFSTAGECVDAMAARFLSAPLSDAQRGELLKALGAADAGAPLARDTVDPNRWQTALRLLLSCAEYQVC